VFRYNSVTDSYIEAHSLQGHTRACRRWEVYGNTFRQVDRGSWTPVFFRGGTGVIFDNTLVGTWSQPSVTFDNVRSFEPRGDTGQCDGSSPWDGNQLANGWPCRDQIGRSTDAWLWNDGVNPYPPQASDPAYIWNNTGFGATKVHNGTGPWIQLNRDYYEGTPKPGYTPYRYPHPLTLGPPISPSNLKIVR